MGKNVLIACSHFWPSLGGVEVSMQQLGEELSQAGYSVTVLTLHHPARESLQLGALRIAEATLEELQLAVRSAIQSGDYQACILVQDPLGTIPWAAEGITPPAGTRVFIQPIINEDGYSRWSADRAFKARLVALLQGATAALCMTQQGPDMRFMSENGIRPCYLPNAVSPAQANIDFRKSCGISQDRFVILHVANLYWVKNHIGLLQALRDMPAHWQLVMIGRPSGSSECAQAVQDALADRPEVLYIPGLPPDAVSAAMEAADVVVLASHGEGSPITILEAMAHRKPWIARPTCGAVNDHCGGIVAELGEFFDNLQQLDRQPEKRNALGEVGYQHWRKNYSWPAVIEGWKDLIETGHLQRSYSTDTQLRQASVNIAKSLSMTDIPRISIVVVTFNHAPYLEKTLAGIEAQEFDGQIEVVIHDDASTDKTAEICANYKASSRHEVKIVRQPLNIYSRGISLWPSIIPACTGQYVATCEGDDFWLAPNKLQNQFTALQTLPDVDICFHRVVGVEWQSEQPIKLYCDYGEEPKLYSAEDVIEGDGGFMPSPSLFFRKRILDILPPWFFGPLTIGDYYLQVFGAQKGGAVYLPMTAAAYRTGDPSAWSQRVTRSMASINQFDLEFLENLLNLKRSLSPLQATSIDRIFMHRYAQLISRCAGAKDLVTLKRASAILLSDV